VLEAVEEDEEVLEVLEVLDAVEEDVEVLEVLKP